MSRGRLRVYLGMAPGVGKTYAMLDEGRRRLGRGTDVVVGIVETHGRAHTAERLEELEVVPRKQLSYRGTTFEEMDLDAVLARHPAVALVDELAHSNIPGSRHEKRWQDVDTLLDAGIDVITTVNIQHLESLNDVVQRISGVEQRETIPDEVVRRADQIEIVDIAPEALRRRMAHGNIYPSDRVDAALSNYFRIGNLSALRELALLWVAERVDEGLQRYRAAHGIDQPWEARERIVVALPGGPEGETLLRRAVRIATRTTGADLLALHVVKGDGLAGLDPAELGRQRRLAESMGGSWHQVVGDDVAVALLDFARVENATQIVLGASSRGRWEAFLSGEGIGARVARLSGKIDVHLVTHEAARGPGRLPSLPVAGLTTALSVRRRMQGAVAALVLLPLLTFALSRVRADLNLPSDILLYLAVVIVVALIGGLWPALAAAVVGSLLLNYYFTPPLYTFTISDKNNALALLEFIGVAALVSVLVERVVRRTTEAGRASAEAAILAGLAGGILRGETSLPEILGRARETFGLEAVTLLERRDTSGPWQEVAHVGEARPGTARSDVPVGDRLQLSVDGTVRAADQRLLSAFAAQAAAVHEHDQLATRAAEASVVEEADRTRSALLAAVSHDLRSPLASAKASVTSLRSDRVQWTPAAQAELLATADESLNRLTRLIENLLDMSRLEAGALGVSLGPVALDELVPLVLDALGADASQVRVKVPETLPEVRADAVLLERVLVNLLGNAVRYSPPQTPPLLAASCHAGTMDIRVVDRGPGVPESQSDALFAPFQRLGDRDNTTGVGLGLALSRGLTEAMGGTLAAEDTPGGGLTMTVTLPLVGNPVVSQPSVGGAHVTRVLVVDDEPQILRALVVNMRARGYDVHTASDGASALRTAGLHPPDLVVLDLGLPDMEGTDVIAGLRGWTTAPIIVLTGRTEQLQKIAALDAGADDYVTKPFGIEELFARMRAVSRRVTAQHAPSVALGEWVVDLAAHRIRPASGEGDDQKLTPTEWRILEILVRNPGRLITKQQLLHEVWGPSYSTENQYLRLYLAQLRRKLEPDPARPAYLLTETGMGYRFRPDDDEPLG